jgi:hypothetical protein
LIGAAGSRLLDRKEVLNGDPRETHAARRLSCPPTGSKYLLPNSTGKINRAMFYMELNILPE